MSLASMLLAGGIISSCGTSSDDLADNGNGIDGIVDRNDDNGTGVGNTGGDGKTLIEDSKEKKFIEETGQVLNSYLNAAETEQLTEVYKEIAKLDKGELDDLADLLFEETAITRAYSEVINYHNVIVSATNVKGKYTASYGGKWKKIAESDNLIMEYTDSHNAVWLLTASAQGKMGRVYTDIRKGSYTYSQTVQGDYITTYDGRYYIIEVPKVSNVLLTRNGEEKVKCQVNITAMNNTGENYSPTPLSSAEGSALVQITPQSGKETIVSTQFCYMPNKDGGVYANTTVQKNGKILIKEKFRGSATTTSNEPLIGNAQNWDRFNENVKTSNAEGTVEVDILGRLQVHITVNEARPIFEAFDEANDNISDETVVKNCVAKMNNYTNGYLTNNGGDAHQAILKFGIKPSSKSVYMYNSGNYTYTDYYTYDITPILQFHDGSSYLVEDYFSETTFQNVYDKIKSFLSNVENQLK